MAKVDIFMPFYVGDYLKDTNRLSAAEHGAYLMLMLDYWQNGPIPDDERILFRLSRMSASEWAESKDVLLGYFKRRDGKLIHSRIDRELKAAIERKEHFSERGKAGAAAKWKDHKPASSNATSNATSIKQASKNYAKPMLSRWPSPSPSPSPSHTARELYTGARADLVNEVLGCRGEFKNLKPEFIAKVIHDAESNPRMKTNHSEFIASAANMLKAPNDPIGLYRKFLASTGGKSGKTERTVKFK